MVRRKGLGLPRDLDYATEQSTARQAPPPFDCGLRFAPPSAQDEGFCHFKNLFSNNFTAPYNNKAKATNVNTATKTIGVSY